MNKRARACDALVIGAGPAGSTAALLLARAGWSVALIEKASFPRPKVCGEYVSGTTLPLLDRLGVGDAFSALAGPEVRRVGLYSGATIVTAPMPHAASVLPAGRALAREHFDGLLLRAARSAGAQVLQPWRVLQLTRADGGFAATAMCSISKTTRELRARTVIAAHGSWESGPLPTQAARDRKRASDLLAFKARFRNCSLEPGVMPLIAFRGGYGGLVHTDGGRVSVSCCVRRDELARCRKANPHASAGQALLAHIRSSCDGVRRTLEHATVDGAWLGVGPIQPGIRSFYNEGIFVVGNAAAEAHPIVAEGITMAVQSAWLLSERLLAARNLGERELAVAGYEYERAWRRNFAARLRASNIFAQLAMRPTSAALAAIVLRLAPAILTLGADWSGKARILAPAEFGLRQTLPEAD